MIIDLLGLTLAVPLWAQTFQPGLTPRPDLPAPPPPEPIPLVTPPPPDVETPTLDLAVVLQSIEIRGSTVFEPEVFVPLASTYLNRPLIFEDLLALRTAITQLYIERGFITSAAFLPPQDLSAGTLVLQVIEGELEAVNITGLQRLRDRYVRDRVELATQAPININALEAALQLLRQDPLFGELRAELTAGSAQGRSILELEIIEAAAFTLSVGTSSRDDSTDSNLQPSIRLQHRNLFGLGDSITVTTNLTTSGNSYDLNYRIPVNARNGTLGVRFSTSDSRLIDPVFTPLNIRGFSTEWGIQFRQPLRRTANSEWALFSNLDVRRSQTFVFGDIPFSFVPGAQDGRLRSTILSVGSEWFQRDSSRILSGRVQLNLGLPLFDATENPAGIPDSRFASLTGQAQWVESLRPNLVLVGRGSFQLANDSLLLQDQVRLGSADLRGYPTGFSSADNAVLGSLELRWQFLNAPEGVGTFQLVPFFDVARLWNQNGAAPIQANLASVGAGLTWQFRDRLSAQFTYGIPLRTPTNFVDNGRFSFSVQVNLIN